jgi:hypothetical protein
MYRTVWLTYRQPIGVSDYPVGPRHYWVLCIGQSDIRGVGLQVGPVNTGYYVSDSLTYVPSENRGVGLQVEPAITGYYVSDSLTNLPSDNRGVGLQVW